MSITAEQTGELLREAEELVASRNRARAPLVDIAHRLGLEVWLKSTTAQSKFAKGYLEYSSPPRVTINRRTQATFSKRLVAGDDELLQLRDRFTLAHEIGHWLAYRQFKVGPATQRSEYWRDEEAVNKIAARLLVPNRLLDAWLGTLSDKQSIHVQLMAAWAREAAASRAVVSLRICEKHDDTGFLALQVKLGRSQCVPDLLVTHSAGGPALGLPARGRILRSEPLAALLESAATAAGKLPLFSFDCPPKQRRTYLVSWTSVGERYSGQLASTGESPRLALGSVYWMSWSKIGFARGPEGNSIGPFL